MIERKTIKKSQLYLVDDYARFGWVEAQDGASDHLFGKTFDIIRNTDIPNFAEIARLEKIYFSREVHLKKYDFIDPGIAIVLFFFAIIPGVIYIIVKIIKKRRIDKENKEIRAELDAILERVDKLFGRETQSEKDAKLAEKSKKGKNESSKKAEEPKENE